MEEILVPISLFMVAGAIIITTLILRYHKRKVESQEILAAIEKGVEVKFPENRNSRLLPGLIYTLMGIVFTLALAVSSDVPEGAWVWGLIPVAAGVAYLIVYRIEQQKGDSEAH